MAESRLETWLNSSKRSNIEIKSYKKYLSDGKKDIITQLDADTYKILFQKNYLESGLEKG